MRIEGIAAPAFGAVVANDVRSQRGKNEFLID
jgi:hypothetical protein